MTPEELQQVACESLVRAKIACEANGDDPAEWEETFDRLRAKIAEPKEPTNEEEYPEFLPF